MNYTTMFTQQKNRSTQFFVGCYEDPYYKTEDGKNISQPEMIEYIKERFQAAGFDPALMKCTVSDEFYWSRILSALKSPFCGAQNFIIVSYNQDRGEWVTESVSCACLYEGFRFGGYKQFVWRATEWTPEEEASLNRGFLLAEYGDELPDMINVSEEEFIARFQDRGYSDIVPSQELKTVGYYCIPKI